jgi:hypothetical protein
MSYKPEVQTDSSGKWYGNALRFATYEEAFENARDLSCRWFAVMDFRASESSDPVNYAYRDHKLVTLESKETTP